eukprot:1833562-Pyramimonas_sp.AAC.1
MLRRRRQRRGRRHRKRRQPRADEELRGAAMPGCVAARSIAAPVGLRGGQLRSQRRLARPPPNRKWRKTRF